MANQVARIVVRCEEANETQILGKIFALELHRNNFLFAMTYGPTL